MSIGLQISKLIVEKYGGGGGGWGVNILQGEWQGVDLPNVH